MEHIVELLPVYLRPLFESFLGSGKWFALCFVLFVPLAYLFPSKPDQPHFRRDMAADSAYWFFGPVVYGAVALLMGNFLFSTDMVKDIYAHGTHSFAAWPILLQALIILLITDFLQYWIHRAFHYGAFWKYHAVHHSSTHVDWLSSARFHPVNIVLYSTLVNVLVICLGFNQEAFYLLIPFNAIYSPLVHANLNWSYGPFKYVLASPVFHRWHHTYYNEGGNKNFAPTFPFIDLMFGTFYMPKGKRPLVFGTPHDPVPGHFFGQLFYPFTRIGK